MLRVGVLGSGHLGKIHLQQLKKSDYFDLVGFFDPNESIACSVEKEYGYKRFKSMEKLIDTVSVVDIVTPTLSHYQCAMKAIEYGKHIFIEKPLANTIEEGEEIISFSTKRGVRGQVGHIERFNPAFVAIKNKIKNPMFIEVHRLAEFNPRGTDVSVVYDLMIHDIDIILSVIKSEVKHISSNGVSVISKSPDIANVRLEFENGCVVNLTASRISLKNMRKMRFFQKNTYLSVDFFNKKNEIVNITDFDSSKENFDITLQNAEGEKKVISFENIETPNGNALQDELEAFAIAIKENKLPEVDLSQGLRAMKIANKIVNKFNK